MIKVLDKSLADKIAAGEVIERPLSIVKELVENSIDAGATNIVVEIRNGGKSYIRVTDNGCGIPSDEVSTAFMRHATGKISQIEDLDRISTLGFRGEALASIAAVSRLTIYTKPENEIVGTKMILHGGNRIAREDVGMNRGTTIVVEDVFYNTPARRKFMKTDAAEASPIIDLIQRLAICYSGIAFKFINNGLTVISTSGDGDTLNAIKEIYPSKEYSELIEIKGDGVHGFISDPGTTKKSRRGEIFFVNGRSVQSAEIERGIVKGYSGRIFEGYPIAIVFVETEPEDIDVNIHPNKKEIKFLNAGKIEEALEAAVKSVIKSEEAVPSAIRKADIPEEIREQERSEQTDIRSYLASVERPADEISREKHEDDIFANFNYSENNGIITETEKSEVGEGVAPGYFADDSAAGAESYGEADASGSYEDTASTRSENGTEGAFEEGGADDDAHPSIVIEPPKVRPFEFSDLRVQGYIFGTYIITEVRDMLYVLDQHAAHERIIYEKLVGKYEANERLYQPILAPITIEVASDIYNSDRNFLHALRRLGYEIDDFGVNTFVIRGIPEYMSVDEAENFARTYIEDYEEVESKGYGNEVVIDKLIMRSCKAAIKAHDYLSVPEIRALLAQLGECVNPFSCPHGRPTFIKVSRYEVERAFHRK